MNSELKPIAWSFSALNDYRNCPRQYHEVRILKNFKDPDNEHNIWGNRVHTAIEESLRVGTALPAGMDVWQPIVEQFRKLKGTMLVEQELALTMELEPCAWMAADVWLRGKIDALWIDGAVAKAVDWKTGKRKPNSEQLALFALLVFHHYPEVQEVRTMFVWLKTGQQDGETFTRDQIPRLWNLFLPDVRRIRQSQKTDTWVPKSSGLCSRFCPVVTCSFNGRRRQGSNW